MCYIHFMPAQPTSGLGFGIEWGHHAGAAGGVQLLKTQGPAISRSTAASPVHLACARPVLGSCYGASASLALAGESAHLQAAAAPGCCELTACCQGCSACCLGSSPPGRALMSYLLPVCSSKLPLLAALALAICLSFEDNVHLFLLHPACAWLQEHVHFCNSPFPSRHL